MDKPNIHMLMGNHEQMMLDAILHPNGVSLNGETGMKPMNSSGSKTVAA